jgi:hypothetical protein
MKTMRICGIFSALVLLGLAGCVSTQTANLTIDDLAGTWTNEEYDHIASPISAKVVITADGVARTFDLIADEKVRSTYKLSIVESWYDENGDVWFKCVWERIGAKAEVAKTNVYYSLNRLSVSGTIWDYCLKASDYPTEIAQLAGAVVVYFRQ